MTRMLRSALALALVSLATTPVAAAVKLPSIFADHMVLQRDTPIAVWGTADPGEAITVKLGGASVSGAAGSDGRFALKLPAIAAGGPHTLTVNAIEVKDVLVGEVWVCSGQSNMEWPVGAAQDPEKEAAAANYPKLRHFAVKKAIASEPLADAPGAWAVCAPDTVGAFTAVGYFFGRELLADLDVPIGLVHTSWGGTAAEAWTSRAALTADADLKPLVERWDAAIAKDAKAAENPNRVSSLYNAMLAPIAPYAIRGAIWYQGESNASRAFQYRKLFSTMIQDWRQRFGRGDFPFLFVQLANFTPALPEPAESDWAELREAQTMTLALPNTAMAVTIDIGDAADIHPRNKQEVGRRLALAARAMTYGRKVPFSGPMYQSMAVEGDAIRVRFAHADGGLAARDGAPLRGFAIAGPDKKFVWADETKIDGASVVVRSAKVAQPVAVRYAWANNPEGCNLVNADGKLPASPFRTDDWPGVTQANN
jgi:sialate O-acetylesterase